MAIRSAPSDERQSRTLTALCAGASLLAAFVVAGCGGAAEAQGGPPQAPPVSVSPAVQRQVIDSEEFSGRLEATDYVELRPQVAGRIDKVHFADGAMVRKGTLLFSIDPRPFEAEVARAEAQLAAVQSRFELASAELRRAEGLLKQEAVSRQEFDQLTSGSRTSAADIRASQAALRIARLNLDYTQVRSPIDGRASYAAITVGNLVGNQSVLTTIAGVAKVYAYFDSSEQSFLRMKSGRLAGKAPTVYMALANEQGFPHRGQIDFIDNRLNAQTGAIRMRASFDNSKGEFTPGLAAKLKMESSAPHDAVLVPDRAIGTDQTKKVVYVVPADGRPQPREVKTGQLVGGMRVLLSDTIKPGENVVVDGLQRVMPGMPVKAQVLQTDANGMPLPPAPAAPGAPGAPAAPASAGAGASAPR